MTQIIGEITTERLKREHFYLECLVRVGEALSKALDWHDTLTSVCTAVVADVADICILTLKEADNYFVAAAAHRDPNLSPMLLQSNEYLKSTRTNVVHHAVQAATTGESLLIPHVDENYLRRHAASDEHEAFMRKLRYSSLIVVPLASETQGILGALSMVRTEGHLEPYDAEALRLAGDIARRCAMAIAKARLYDQTRRIATLFQRSALPSHLPQRPDVRFDACYEPSSEYMLVGGDWYDAFELRDGRIAITVGDVLGHGVEAAVWMSRLSNGLRAALLTVPDPGNALRVADEILRAEKREEFTTAIAAIYDPKDRSLIISSAGHPGPLIWSGTEVIDPVVERSLPLGLRAPMSESPTRLTLKPGDFVVLFTDGLLEWKRDIAGAWESLYSAIADEGVRNADNPAHAMRDAVVKSEEHSDDIAVLTMSIC